MRALYISHMGMTEPLGQSQVLPYLVGLAREGHEIEILSFEATGTKPEAIEALRARLEDEGMRYRPLVRSASHHLAAKVWESALGFGRALELALRKKPEVVHARMVYALVVGAAPIITYRSTSAADVVRTTIFLPATTSTVNTLSSPAATVPLVLRWVTVAGGGSAGGAPVPSL